MCRRLRHDIRLDPLTVLRNRRALAEDLPVLEELARRHGEPYAVALCDADRFKAYNDALGHLAGDEALRAVAATVRGVMRTGDAAYRYIADAILHKPDALDEVEWREIQRNPGIGARILEHGGLRDIADWVRAHHERADGTGYPGRLQADEIPRRASSRWPTPTRR